MWTCFKSWLQNGKTSMNHSVSSIPQQFSLSYWTFASQQWGSLHKNWRVLCHENYRHKDGTTVTRWLWTIQSSKVCIVCSCEVSTHMIFFSTKTIQHRREMLGLKSSNQLKPTSGAMYNGNMWTLWQWQMHTLLLQDWAMKVNECICYITIYHG